MAAVSVSRSRINNRRLAFIRLKLISFPVTFTGRVLVSLRTTTLLSPPACSCGLRRRPSAGPPRPDPEFQLRPRHRHDCRRPGGGVPEPRSGPPHRHRRRRDLRIRQHRRRTDRGGSSPGARVPSRTTAAFTRPCAARSSSVDHLSQRDLHEDRLLSLSTLVAASRCRAAGRRAGTDRSADRRHRRRRQPGRHRRRPAGPEPRAASARREGVREADDHRPLRR